MTTATTSMKPFYRRLTLLAIFLLSAYIFIQVYARISDLIVAVVISVVLTYLFKPTVLQLEHYGFHRVLSILTVFAGVVVLLSAWGNYLVPQLIDEAALLASNLEQLDISEFHEKTILWLNNRMPGAAELLGLQSGQAEQLVERFRGLATTYLQGTTRYVAGAFNVLGLSVVVPFLTFFMLKDGSHIMKRFIEKVPNRLFEMTLSLSYRIDQQLGNYLRSILIESLVVGLLTWLAFALLGFKFALVLGIVHGLLNMIPFFGPMVAYLPIGAVVFLTNDPASWGLFWMTVIMIIVQVIDNLLLKPLIISKSVDVHPAMVLLVVLIGGRLAGALGMFIAVPVYAVLQAIFFDFYEHLKRYRII